LENGKRKRRSASRVQIRRREASIDIENAGEKTLNEEVEREEEEAQDEKECAEGEAALGETADGMEKARGNYSETRFGAWQVKRTDGLIAGEIAAEGGEFIFHPEGEFFAVAPEIQGTKKKNTIAETSQQSKSRTRTPIKHGTSPPP
jgi:hypothetical protein